MKDKKLKIIFLWSIGILVTIVLYIVAVQLYSNRFVPVTIINGIDCSSDTVDEVYNKMKENIEKYTITIKQSGVENREIKSNEIELKVTNKEALDKEVHKTNKFMKPVFFITKTFKKREIKIDNLYSIKDSMLKDKVRIICEDKSLTEPVDAKIKYNKNTKKYEIQKEKTGTMLDFDKAYNKIKESILTQESEVNVNDCLKEANIKSDNNKLNKTLNKVNSYLISIKFDFGDREEEITPEMIESWITIKDNKVKLDSEAIREYVIELSNKYDTYGTTRKFKTHSGKTINVSGGSYGWMIRRDYTVDKIIKTIKKGKNTKIKPVYSYEGFRREKDEIGNTYIEINLAEQHVYVYKDGKLLVDSPCVTGNTSLGRGTPAGVYPLNYKTRNATLTGQGYASPVSYWMPFNNNIGLHDASWRSSFGGSIYRTNGSHGCVNLPTEKARQIYNVITEKEPVIVY